MNETRLPIIYGLLRISMGWVFLWTFIDKLFGLGFSTESGKAWVDGVSPTTGFLKFGTEGGTFAELFQGLAGSPIVDWLYMIGMLGVGLALVLGIMVRFSSWAGVALMALIFVASLPLAHNPLVDEHVIYILVLISLPIIKAGRAWGLGSYWRKLGFVKRNPFWE